ncbi:hypothetical protein DL767_001524 [Monosporascus sp. MG133]|nr:hypothetical protein DL767_001524 [Monosporascus sp. MG133]
MWPNGSTLRVSFIGGTQYLRDKVKQYATQWLYYVNLHMEFIEYGEADIRIAFMQGKGSWSMVGKQQGASFCNQWEPTMNFGWFNNNTEESEFSRTVLYEFGHALGCLHEHQSSAGAIQWNRPVVEQYHVHADWWTPKQVKQWVFDRFDGTMTQFTVFDPRSIMLYMVPPEFTYNGYSTGSNWFLSETDKQFITPLYPRNTLTAPPPPREPPHRIPAAH